MLDHLSNWVLAEVVIDRLSKLTQVEVIRSNGSTGLFLATEADQALQFALQAGGRYAHPARQF